MGDGRVMSGGRDEGGEEGGKRGGRLVSEG